MASQKVKIIMKAGKRGSDIILGKVGCCWRKQVWRQLHFFSKYVVTKSQTYCCHFTGCFTSIYHMSTPAIHFFFPLREIFRYSFGNFVSYLSWSFTNRPEKSPFCIKNRRERRSRFVFLRYLLNYLIMITCFLYRFCGDTCLVAEFRVAVFQNLSSVIFFTLLFKILFYHIDIFLVGGVIHSWVFYN